MDKNAYSQVKISDMAPEDHTTPVSMKYVDRHVYGYHIRRRWLTLLAIVIGIAAYILIMGIRGGVGWQVALTLLVYYGGIFGIVLVIVLIVKHAQSNRVKNTPKRPGERWRGIAFPHFISNAGTGVIYVTDVGISWQSLLKTASFSLVPSQLLEIKKGRKQRIGIAISGQEVILVVADNELGTRNLNWTISDVDGFIAAIQGNNTSSIPPAQ